MSTNAAVPTPVDLPSLPRDEDGPVFAEPWQAQAFSMAVRLHEQGHFEWSEWAEYLSQSIAAAPTSDGSDYYLLWLDALEKVVADKGLASSDELSDRYAAWDAAAKATPHGQPIELDG